jgi:hypothetical protein
MKQELIINLTNYISAVLDIYDQGLEETYDQKQNNKSKKSPSA